MTIPLPMGTKAPRKVIRKRRSGDPIRGRGS